MAQAKVTTATLDGRQIDIYVTETGEFWGKYDETENGLLAPTLKELKKKLLEKLRKKGLRVSIPITAIDTPNSWYHRRSGYLPEFHDGTLTGIHAGNGNPIIKFDNGTQPHWEHLCRRLTDEEKERYVGAFQAEREARELIDKLDTEWKINTDQAVEKAAKAQADKPGGAEKATTDTK